MVAGAVGFQFLEEREIEIEDCGAAGVDQAGVEFAQAADGAALPPEFGAAGRVFPGIGFAL